MENDLQNSLWVHTDMMPFLKRKGGDYCRLKTLKYSRAMDIIIYFTSAISIVSAYSLGRTKSIRNLKCEEIITFEDFKAILIRGAFFVLMNYYYYLKHEITKVEGVFNRRGAFMLTNTGGSFM